ncbi:LOW QUALITY PROTEIN: hypothetical protein ACHAXR_011221 [Thalassiosira sp. AJA248-18]
MHCIEISESGGSGSSRDIRIRELKRIHEGYAMAVRSVFRFVAFVDLNVRRLRKILKKHYIITKQKFCITPGRFIADKFSNRNRTSAAFICKLYLRNFMVTAGALGIACGPALAAMLSQFSFPLEGKLWTVETAPGWIVMCIWSIFLVASVLFFNEPDRSHIFGNKKASLELAAKNDNREDKYLLADVNSSGEIESNPDPPIYANVPVMVTLWVYFILKLVLECLMSSCPTLTMYFFGSQGHLGYTWHFWDCSCSFSHRYEDREPIHYSLVVMLCSIMGIIAYCPGDYSVVQYMAFGVCIFIATNALEGPTMGLLSKTIPRSWARGISTRGSWQQRRDS